MNWYGTYKDSPKSVGNVLYHLNKILPIRIVEMTNVGSGKVTHYINDELVATYTFDDKGQAIIKLAESYKHWESNG